MAAPDWWLALDEKTRDTLNGLAIVSPSDVDAWPYWDDGLARDVLAWIELDGDVETAHTAWFTALVERVAALRQPWTYRTMLRASRHLDGLTTPPPYLTGEEAS